VRIGDLFGIALGVGLVAYLVLTLLFPEKF
jgi:K+-transporting ATPase KdpF subunit